jgi:hypothetical protein
MCFLVLCGAVGADDEKAVQALEITEVFVAFDPDPDLVFIHGLNFETRRPVACRIPESGLPTLRAYGSLRAPLSFVAAIT